MSCARNVLLAGASAIAVSLFSASALAQQALKNFSIEAQALDSALTEFAEQADIIVMAPGHLVGGKQAPSVEGKLQAADALDKLLQGSGLEANHDASGAVFIAMQSDDDDVAMVDSRLDQQQAIVEVEEIVVIGSNIRGVGFGASSGIVLDRDDIELSGFSSLEELIESIPQNFGGGAALDTAGGNIDAIGRSAGLNPTRSASVNLRGLGSESSLVLVNGRRLVPTGSSIFIDVSTIPLTAVERIEVLTDGASAVYGSDAVAGVVNFVLRDDFEGVETHFRYGTVTSGGMNEYRASQLFGGNWGVGNALAVYEYSKEDSLPASERQFAVDAGAPPAYDLLPETTQHNVFSTINQNVTDNTSIFAELLYSTRESVAIAESFGLQQQEADTTQLNVTAGVNVTVLNDWQFDFHGIYGQQHSDFVDAEAFTLANPVEFEQKNDLWSLEGKFEGPTLKTPGGDVRFAVGAAYRKQDFESNRGVSTFSPNRNVFSAYGEMFIPIVSEQNRIRGVEQLEVTVAARYEDYSDFGNSTDPKVGIRWSPYAGFSLRGTYGTSFRAPTLFDLSTNSLTAFLANVFDPNAADLNTILFGITGASDGSLGPEQSTAWTGGFDFSPEFAEGLSVSLTYYTLSYEGRIDFPTQDLFGALLEPDVFASILDFSPSQSQIDNALAIAPSFVNVTQFIGPFAEPMDAEAFIDGTLQNIGRTDTSGLDFSVSYSADTDLGTFAFGFNGNYIFEFEQQVAPSATAVELVDTIFNPADFRFRGSISWTSNRLTTAAFINHTSGYLNDTVTPVEGVDSWTTVDLRMSFDTSGQFEVGLLKDMQLAISVRNLLDEDPPLAVTPTTFLSVGYDAANANPIGRFISFEVTKRW